MKKGIHPKNYRYVVFQDVSCDYSFLTKSISEKNAYISIIIGITAGLLFFPSPDFSKSILVGILFPIDFFPSFVSQSLLFLSFLISTFIPVFTWKTK